MLSRLAWMVQAAVLGGQFFDLFSLFDDGGVASSRRQLEFLPMLLVSGRIVGCLVVIDMKALIWFLEIAGYDN